MWYLNNYDNTILSFIHGFYTDFTFNSIYYNLDTIVHHFRYNTIIFLICLIIFRQWLVLTWNASKVYPILKLSIAKQFGKITHWHLIIHIHITYTNAYICLRSYGRKPEYPEETNLSNRVTAMTHLTRLALTTPGIHSMLACSYILHP